MTTTITPTTITIEVAFATALLQKIITVTISSTATIPEAIRSSAIGEFFPDYDLLQLPYGIWGKRIFGASLEKSDALTQLKSGDRIEIYRPLLKSPNQQRIERAKNK